eukprot:TRINITY_DN1181_c0_g1_i2.p1 TRINITY_DN1181_c0_g1~~TRINITY_DN1181_c0_g1_i2.p1  ORF type:complete len:372 (+),score=33.35 TRINITY_DN1181_c0_g1_i2:328-1443(+)
MPFGGLSTKPTFLADARRWKGFRAGVTSTSGLHVRCLARPTLSASWSSSSSSASSSSSPYPPSWSPSSSSSSSIVVVVVIRRRLSSVVVVVVRPHIETEAAACLVPLLASAALPSAANPDAIGILQFRHQFGFFHPWCVAFDHVRKRMIALNIDVARMLFATGMDGCAVPRAHVRISDAVFAAVDRQSSNCVVVVCSHGQTSVRYLDENFRCTQHPVGITSPRGSFALRPNGRLFLCAADGIYSVDPRSRESRRLLDKGMTSPVVCSSPIAADERDCLVIAHRDGITTFDSEGRHVSTLAVTNVRQLAISRDGIMAVLRRQGDDDDEPVQSEVLFFASNTSESPPLCRYCLPPNYIVGHIVWADERLLVVS